MASILVTMSIYRFCLALSLLTQIASTVLAVSIDSQGIDNKSLYGIEFSGDTRAYYGRESGIFSISKQEYVTANFRVLEVNVVTNGPALLRIYHSRPLEPGELATALSDAAQKMGVPGASIAQKQLPKSVTNLTEKAAELSDTITSSTVMKEYPYATHAHTIEFRISSRNELLKLHDELKKHWLKEPAFFEAGQIVEEDGATDKEMKPRSLGGTLFTVTE